MFVFRFAFVCVFNTEQGSHLCPDVCDARSPDNCRLWTMIQSLVINVPFSPKRHARLSTIQSISFGRLTKILARLGQICRNGPLSYQSTGPFISSPPLFFLIFSLFVLLQFLQSIHFLSLKVLNFFKDADESRSLRHSLEGRHFPIETLFLNPAFVCLY